MHSNSQLTSYKNVFLVFIKKHYKILTSRLKKIL